MSTPSFMLFPGGYKRCIISCHFLKRFIGTAPNRLTVKVEKGGDRKGTALEPSVDSLVKYLLMMCNRDVVD